MKTLLHRFMTALGLGLMFGAGMWIASAQQTALSMNLPIRVDSNGNLLVAAAAPGVGTQTTRTMPNQILKVDSSGNLLIALNGGTATPNSLCLDATNQDTCWSRAAAGVFNLNSTQTTNGLRVPNGSNLEYGGIDWSANAFETGTVVNGGTARNYRVKAAGAAGIVFATNGVDAWQFNSSGHFFALTDNTFDIGASGATRPRTVYIGTSAVIPTLNVTTAYQFNGNAFANATIGPSSPAGTTSTTLVMAGLAGSITTRTGRVVICMSGYLTDNTANDGTRAQISYGTGTAPTNGAALTGTQVGPIQQYNASTLAASASAPYGACWTVTTLSGGTTYWLDTAFSAITGGTGSLVQASMIAYDIP